MPSFEPDNRNRTYDIVFVFTYLANIFLLIAISLLFRYSDFVESAGGNEWHLGWIVGLSTIAAIAFRIFQGQAVDRFGPLAVWSLSLIGLTISLLWHTRIDTVFSWQVYAARLLMNAGIAGTFGAWLSFVSLRVSGPKVAEVIGMVGTSGFLGMALGPVIGDRIFGGTDEGQAVKQMFQIAAALTTVSLACALVAGWLSRKEKAARRISSPGYWSILRDSNPGFLLVIAVIMGMAISMPGIFLRPFAAARGIEQIQVFFVTYNIVAFVCRLIFRRAPEYLGLRTMILIGLGLMSLSMLFYLVVRSEPTLVLPAILAGLAHSFIFPSVIAGGTSSFPTANRGTATSLMLAMYDLGVLVGSPLIGVTLMTTRKMDLPDYPLTFCLMAALVAAAGIGFAIRYVSGTSSSLLRRSPV